MRNDLSRPTNLEMPAAINPVVLAPVTSQGEAALSTMMDSALVSLTQDRCRALLAKSALEHTGALSCLAAQLSALDPTESDQYYRIVAAYIRGVVRQIEGW